MFATYFTPRLLKNDSKRGLDKFKYLPIKSSQSRSCEFFFIMHNQYSIIPASVLLSKELTSTEKLLVGVISNLSNIRGYCFASNYYLAECLGLSKHTVRKAIAELEEKGVLGRVIKLNSRNEVEVRCLTINPDAEILSRTKTPEVSSISEDGDEEPVIDNKSTYDQSWAHPVTKDGHTLDTRFSHNKKNKVKEEIYKYSFEQFWLEYDKKVDKKQTLAVWNKLSAEDRTLAVEGMANHKSGRERKYWKDPVRYLRDRRWEDETQTKTIKQTPKQDDNNTW